MLNFLNFLNSDCLVNFVLLFCSYMGGANFWGTGRDDVSAEFFDNVDL